MENKSTQHNYQGSQNVWVRLCARHRRCGPHVIDLTLDLGEGCFPRFVELTPRILKILLAASNKVSLPLDPLLIRIDNPLIAI